MECTVVQYGPSALDLLLISSAGMLLGTAVLAAGVVVLMRMIGEDE